MPYKQRDSRSSKLQTLAESTPSRERGKLWLPAGDSLLTLTLPDGYLRMWRCYTCPFTGQWAENVAHYRKGIYEAVPTLGTEEVCVQ
jgi:hypothetical protein